MSKPALKVVRNEAQPKEASIYLYGIIGDYWFSDDPLTARKFLKALSALEAQYDVIHIHINSPGGDVFEGLAMCNAIKASKKEIHTWNDGMAASMGGCILLSAKKENRHAAKSSMLMLHSASTITWGNAKDMRETADMLDTTDKTLANFIADAAGISVDAAVATYMDHKDHWLGADDAEAAGFVKIEDYEAEDIPEREILEDMDKVAAFYHPKFNPKNETPKPEPEMGLLTNKFKKLSALAKVAVADLKKEDVEAINTELAEAEIEGVSLVLDADLEETINAAAKVPALEKQVSDKDAEIATLTAKVAEQAKALGKPAEEPNTPAAGTDPQPEGEKTVVDTFETSADKELKKFLGQ
jgi:ATP-dependent protease ClpP protease subunit